MITITRIFPSCFKSEGVPFIKRHSLHEFIDDGPGLAEFISQAFKPNHTWTEFDKDTRYLWKAPLSIRELNIAETAIVASVRRGDYIFNIIMYIENCHPDKFSMPRLNVQESRTLAMKIDEYVDELMSDIA
jgi:hypothetical protein